VGYERADTAVGHGAQHVPHHTEPLFWAGHKLGGATDGYDIADRAERYSRELREFEHYFDGPERAGWGSVSTKLRAGSAAGYGPVGSGTM
jgi:hypothetical protein